MEKAFFYFFLLVNMCFANAMTINTKLRKESFLKIRGGADWRYFAAGGIGAATSHGLATPFDVIKTKMQAHPEKYSRNILKSGKDIIANEGVACLLSGITPTIVGYGIEGALKYGIYETLKITFCRVTNVQSFNFLMASVVSAIIASIILAPVELSRIKMVSNVDSKGLSPFQILYLHILHTKSALSIFDGLFPILIKQTPETFVKQLVFDYVLHYARVFMQSIVSQYHLTISTDMQGMMIRFISAFITAILSCLVSHPGDTILTNTHNTATLFPSQQQQQQQQQQSSSAIKRELTNAYSTKEVISQIYSKYGLGGFMLGVEARLMHVVSIVTIQLVIYDLIKQKLGIPVVTSL